MPPKRPLWQDWRLDADEQAEFKAELAAGDPETLERLEWLRAEARLIELSRQLGDWWTWQKLARKPAEFETRLKDVLAEIEACVRELSDVPRSEGRPRRHGQRDAVIYSLRTFLDTEPTRDGRVRFIQKKRTFGQIARMLKTRHDWDLDAKAVRQAYERELKRREKRRSELGQRAPEALAEDT
jgi:hypothetical protein